MKPIFAILFCALFAVVAGAQDYVGGSYTTDQISNQIFVADGGQRGLYLYNILAAATAVIDGCNGPCTTSQVFNQCLMEDPVTHQRGLAIYLVSGSTTVTCPLLATCDGDASAPAYSFASAADTGFYHTIGGNGTEYLSQSINGHRVFTLRKTGFPDQTDVTISASLEDASLFLSATTSACTISSLPSNGAVTDSVPLVLSAAQAAVAAAAQDGADVAINAAPATDGTNTHAAKTGGDIVLTPGAGVNTGAAGTVSVLGALSVSGAFGASTVNGANGLSTSGQIYFNSSTVITAPSNGVLKISNYAETDFTRLDLGGVTSSFPAIGRSATDVVITLADGSSGGFLTLQESAGAPAAAPTASAAVRAYMKADKLIFQYDDAGTVKYWYLDLTGTSGSWTYTTVAP